MLSSPWSSRRAFLAAHRPQRSPPPTSPPTVLYSDLENDAYFSLSLYLSHSGQSCLPLPGITSQINHLHPSPRSGSAFGEPSPRPPPNRTHEYFFSKRLTYAQ